MGGVTGSAFAISLGLYAAVGIVLFLVFSILRRKFRTLYAPKTYLPPNITPHRPPKLPNGFFSWLAPVVSLNQQQVLAYAGMDGLTLLRILYFGLGWTVLATVLCMAAILPCNLVGDNVSVLNEENENLDLTDLDELTVANVDMRDPIIWVHWAVVHLLSFYIFWRLWRMHKEQVGLRVSYFAGQPKGAESHTVLVTDIPGIQSGTPIDRLGDKALFLVPKKQRAMITSKVEGSVKSVAGKVQPSEYSTKQSSAVAASNASVPVPVSTKAATVDSVTAKAGAVMDISVDSVAGIPLSTELLAWPRAQRTLVAGTTPQEYVEREFEEMFGDNFVEAQLVYNTTDVEGVHGEYEARAEKLLDMFDGWGLKARNGKLFKVKKGVEVKEQPTTRVIPPKFGKWGMDRYGKKPVKLGVVDFNMDRITELRRLILEKQVAARGNPAPAAFVTFKSRVQQTLCGTALVHHDTSSWLPSQAPPPEDVLWKNLKWRAWERSIRNSLIIAAFIALVLLFMIPVMAVQGIISSVNWLPSWIMDVSIINAIYTAVVPQLALKIFIALLPPILKQMTVLQGRVSKVEVDLGLESKYYGFQYVVLFLTTLIGGSILSQLKPLIDDPGMIVELLGVGASTQAIFFTNFVMLETLITTPVYLLGIMPLVLFILKSKLAGSERAKARVWQNQFIMYGDDIATMQITFLFIMVFSPIFPIMAPLGVLYHLIAIITYKYTLCYRLRPVVESGGKLWPKVYWQILTATFSMQLLMTFIIAVKKMVAPSIAMIPLLVFTPLFGYITNVRFMRPLKIISLRAAADSDKRDGTTGISSDMEGGATGGHYVASCMKFDEARHEELLAEAGRWKEIFEGAAFDPQEFVGQPSPSEAEDVLLKPDVRSDAQSGAAAV